MNAAAANFFSSVLTTDVVKNNPVLFLHFNRERKILNPASVSASTSTSNTKNKTVQCQFCFTSSPPPPKFVVKRRRRDPVSKRRVKKVFLFCSVCRLKLSDRCFELKQREKLKVQLDDGKRLKPLNNKIATVVPASTSSSGSKASEKKKKKRKEKEQNAGLFIPTSMQKNSPKANLGYTKNAALLKMIKSSEEVKEDKLKSFLKF